MLLTIDAGNTNTVFALYEKESLAHVWRCKTDLGRTADEYAAWLYQLFAQAGLRFEAVKEAIISSVVPDADFHLMSLCQNKFGCAPHNIGHTDFSNILTIDMDKPHEVGADRLVNAAAVIGHYRTPAIVVDFGTATTFDVIEKGNVYKGGIIAPGVNLSMQALHQAAAKLPRVNIKKPDNILGKDTVGAMQSGIYWGYSCMIEGLLQKLAVTLSEKPVVVATGGLASLYAGAVEDIDEVDKDLTLRGLLHIYQSNNQ